MVESRPFNQPHGNLRDGAGGSPAALGKRAAGLGRGQTGNHRLDLDSVNSGFLSPTPQDRANLAQAPPGVTRFRVTFTAPGTFHYICAVHDQLGMNGTVIVY